MEPTAPVVKNVVFFLMGEPHTSPHITGLLHTYSKILHAKGIPQIVCTIDSESMNLGKKIAQDLDCELYIERAVAGPLGDPELKRIIKESKDSSEKLECVQNKITQLQNTKVDAPHINALIASQLVDDQTKRAFNTFLFNNNIPFQGLGHNINAKFRILGFIKNIFNKVLPQISRTGGIVWVSLNAVDILHLAVNILNHIQIHKLTEKCSFNIHPLFCSTPNLSQDIMITLKKCISEKNQRLIFRELDSIYNKFSIEMITDIQEESRGVFDSNDFAKVFDYGERFYKKTNIYHIPNFDEGKKALILENNGKVLEVNDSEAKVSIASEVLLKSMRDQLGITKQKIIFKNNDIYKSREGQLHSYPQFTLEPLPEPDQLMITFPQEDRQLVADIVKVTS